MRVGSSWMRLVPLQKSPQKASMPFHHVRTQKKMVVYRTGSRLSSHPDSADALILDIPAARTGEINFYFLPVYGVLLQQRELTKTLPMRVPGVQVKETKTKSHQACEALKKSPFCSWELVAQRIPTVLWLGSRQSFPGSPNSKGSRRYHRPSARNCSINHNRMSEVEHPWLPMLSDTKPINWVTSSSKFNLLDSSSQRGEAHCLTHCGYDLSLLSRNRHFWGCEYLHWHRAVVLSWGLFLPLTVTFGDV